MVTLVRMLKICSIPAGLRLLLAAILVLLSGPASAQYLLQPGDRVTLSVSGIPELTSEAMIDLDGAIRLPHVGVVKAAGLGIDVLRDQVARQIGERPYRRYGDGGAPVFIAIRSQDVVVAIASYRPVIVSGDVARPGPVAFAPGLTVRGALAMAGGVGAMAVDPGQGNVVRLQGEAELLAQRLVDQQVTEWRLRAELAEDDQLPLDGIHRDLVSDAALQRSIDAARAQLASALEVLLLRRRFLEDAVIQAEGRLKTLDEQAKLEQSAVEVEKEELERISELLRQGLLPIDRLSDVRRARLATETRLIQTNDRITRLQIDQSGFVQERGLLDSRHRERITAELGVVRAAIDETRARRAQVVRELALAGATAGPAALEIDISLIRNGGEALPIDFESALGPGDILTVRLVSAD